jgi:hypothetical protein
VWYIEGMSKITLILPDIHHKVRQATKIINHVGADEVICLGDLFDDFNDTPDMVRESCQWLEWFVNKPNHIMLYGNHDQHYAFEYRSFQAAGYTQWKYFIIYDTLPRQVWDKVKWYHFLDNRWLLSHGGLHKFNVPDSVMKFHTNREKFIEEINKYLSDSIRMGFQMGANGQRSWIFNAGHARFGTQRIGGITWCDFEREFFPVKGINQIVGHTPQQFGIKWCRLTEDEKVFHHPFEDWAPTITQLDNPHLSSNIDLDVYGNMHWATWDGKTLKIGNYKDL